MGACSTPPEPGLKILTTTPEIREIRKIAVELLLANHDQSCPTCSRSANCQLQSLAQRLGVKKVRFKSVHKPVPLDESSPSLVRDPNKCVLCGDCVRMCSEIQGIGAIDFAHRGHEVSVQPAFGKQLGEVECVNCGQCASVCPTGALTSKSEVDQVWETARRPEEDGHRADCAGRARGPRRVLWPEAGRDYHGTDRRGSQASRLRPDLRHIVRRRSYRD